MVVAKVWKLFAPFQGLPNVDEFRLIEEKTHSLKHNEILIEAVYLSLDPYFRVFTSGIDLPGEQVASVIDVTKPRSFGTKVIKVENVPGVSPSLWLGAAGMPGVTAFMAFHNKCQPRPGDVLVVSSAAGAVGSVVGQLAKLKGLTVMGIAGSKEKCQYLQDLGLDYAIDYKTDDISAAIDSITPQGVDIYFDNVGGKISDIVVSKVKAHGRVLICGGISTYNEETKSRSKKTHKAGKNVSFESFGIFSPENMSHFEEVRWKLISLIKEGKLEIKEHITEVFENMPAAFIGLLTGFNFGKALVKV